MALSVDYDALAAGYDRRYRENDYSGVERALVAFVGPEISGRVLEVGCGTGHWLRALSGTATRVIGLDASGNMLAVARAGAREAALAQGRAEQLPWIDGTFDRLFCVNAFHHFEDKPGFLRAARRVLAPGGRMMTIGLDPHIGTDQWYVYDYFEPVRAIDERRYAASEQIRGWMQALQFSDVRTFEVQHLPARIPARAALEHGRLDKNVTSQLALLSDEEYERGIAGLRRALESAEAAGESLYLTADLRLYATCGSVPFQ
jgi:ubiquinone/menaquinone biosynthesis C-methylase UbiE